MNLIFFFAILGTLIGGFCSLLTIVLIFKSSDKVFDALKLQLKELDIESELDELLTKHLNEFMVTLKMQIPMGGMFLTETLNSKLKALAKVEFLKMLPELKDKISARAINSSVFTEIIKKALGKKIKYIILSSTIVGFAIGLIIGLCFFAFNMNICYS